MKKYLSIWIVLWSVVTCFAIISILNDYWIKKKEVEMHEIATKYYVINGLNYLSYSQLKYIAVNELSFVEIEKIVTVCGFTKKASSNGSEIDFHSNSGDFSLQILDRSNSDDFIRYNYHLHTNNREYIRMLRSEIMSESDIEEREKSVTGIINDYWFVCLNNYDIPSIVFQRFQSKKLGSRTK